VTVKVTTFVVRLHGARLERLDLHSWLGSLLGLAPLTARAGSLTSRAS